MDRADRVPVVLPQQLQLCVLIHERAGAYGFVPNLADTGPLGLVDEGTLGGVAYGVPQTLAALARGAAV